MSDSKTEIHSAMFLKIALFIASIHNVKKKSESCPVCDTGTHQ